MTPVYIILAVVAIFAIGAIVSYNRFVKQRNLIKDSWANIDTELRRRYDLIPNLVETVKGYASHEKETFERVTQARAAAVSAQGPEQQAQAENILTSALRQLLAVSEAYPDLKANQGFLQLQGELANTEDRIQTSRRFYNANVRDYNQRVQSFPSMVIARMFGFKDEAFFEVEAEIRDAGAPAVSFDTPASPPAAPAAPPTTPPAAPPTAPPSPPAPPSV